MIDKAKAILFVVAGVVILALVALFRYKPATPGSKSREEILQAARDAKMAKSILKNDGPEDLPAVAKTVENEE